MDNTQLISTLQTVISPVVLISGVGMLVLTMINRFSHAADPGGQGEGPAVSVASPQYSPREGGCFVNALI